MRPGSETSTLPSITSVPLPSETSHFRVTASRAVPSPQTPMGDAGGGEGGAEGGDGGGGGEGGAAGGEGGISNISIVLIP